MLDSDLDALFSGPDAVDVTIGASTFKGLLDTPDETMGGGMVVSTEYVLIAKTSDLVGLDDLEVFTISGVSYTGRRKMKVDDGRLTKVPLSKE